MRRFPPRRPATTLALVALMAGLVVGTSSTPPTSVEATSIVPFGVAFTDNDNGSIATFGNNLMVCPATVSDCQATREGRTNKNNNGYTMVHLDVDGAAFPTFSSSSAAVRLPDGADVRWAGLYWGARLGAGNRGVAATGNGREMKLRAPGDAAYRTITAGRLFGPSSTPDRAYQAFADVTSIVQSAGPGSYTGADVPAATGEDRHSGWSLVVVYRSPALPLRNLTVFDGLADVGQNDPQIITISGFTTPVTGVVNARIGLVAYEGDRGSTGDRAIFNGTQLATTLSPGTNFFNGTNDDNGTLVTARNPPDLNMLGFDIKNFDAPGILGNNATSAQIDLASTSERYFPGVVTTAIDVFAPDFSPSTKTVTNLSGGDPARVGDTLRYTVTFVNGGQDPAINTSIIDPIPAGVSYVPGSLDVQPSDGTGSFNSSLNRVEVSPGNFPVGRSMTFTFDVDVGAAAADTQVANRATIIYDGATVAELQDLEFSTGAAAIAVVPSADLVVTKVNTPEPVVAGQAVTSTIVVRNAGPSPATDVFMVDELPPGVGSVAAQSPRGVCLVTSGSLSCPIGTMTAGEAVTITVQTPVPPGSTAASLTDIARVTSSTADPDPDDNTAGATTDVVRNADLSVTKSASPLTVTPGGTITYTITATNNGPSTATSVAIDDALPDLAVEILSASTPAGPCPADPSNARCSVPSLAPGASVVMTVTAVARPDATPGAIVGNRAEVSSATPDADPSDDVATAEVTLGPTVSDLDVVKTAAAPTPLLAGLGVVRYTIDVTNNGPSDADPVVVSDELPAGFVVVSASSDRGDCTVAPAPSGDVVSCSLGRIVAPFGDPTGGQARVTIEVRVPADVPAGSYSNVASAQTPGGPLFDSNDAPVTVESRANVSIIKSFPADTTDFEITPGEPKTYRIRVINDGPSAAEDVVVTDSLPTGLTATAWRVVSVTPPGPAPACDVATVTCDLGDLPPGTTVELELVVAVDDDLVIVPDVGVTNTASAVSPTADPNTADNTSNFTASGGAEADMSIRKLPPSPDRAIIPVDTPVAGETTSYILEIINFGPSSAPGVVTTDLLPPGVTFVRAFEPELPDFTYDFCSGDGAEPQETVTCDFSLPPAPPDFAFPPSVGTNLGIEVALDPTIANGTVLDNTASITSDVEDGNPGNNSSTATIQVRTEVNLRLTKLSVKLDASGNPVEPLPYPVELDPLQMPAGYAVSFILQVENLGPSAAADVQVVDAFEPDAATFESVACDFLNGEVVCPYEVDGDPDTDDLFLPGETSFQPQLLFVVEGDTPQGVYTNRARVSTSTDETRLDDNADERLVEIVDPIADLIIEKDDVTSPLVAGETFTYQIAVSAGRIDIPTATLRLSSDAEDVVVTDTLPAGLVPASASSSQGTCTVSGQDVTCALGTIGSTIDPERPAPPALVTVTGTVAPDIAGATVPNTAVAESSTDLLGGGERVEATVTTPIERRADLAVTKVADSAATAGGGVAFTVTVTNTGPSDATNVVLTDLLPAPFVFSADGSDDECSPGGGGVVCNLGTIAAGTSRALTIGATLPSDAAPGSVTNTASVTSDVDDPDPSDDSASVPVAVVQAADLAITKTPGAEGVLLGGTIAYTLTVVNEGPSDATGVVLTESIPVGTTVDTLPAGCTGSGPVTCAIDDLAAGGTVALELVLGVPDTLPPGPLANTASVTSATPDPDPSDDEASATVEAVAQADVVLTKRLVTTNPIAGQPVVYELILTNKGPTVAPNASLSDPLPTGSTFVSFEPSQGTCQLDEVEDVPAASCNLGRMEVDATATATLTILTDPNATTISNTGFAGSGGLDEIPADNEATAAGALARLADLSVTKTGPASVSAAAPAAYVIEYRNDGPSTVFDVVVTDTLSAGLIPRQVDGCTIQASTVTCPITSLAPGGTGSITITADVDPGRPLGAVLTDVAAIASSAEDPDPADNTAEVSSTVEAQNDIGVTVTAVQDEVRPGELASYNVVVTNNGPQLASAVTVTNQLPPELIDQAAPGGAAGSSFGVIAAVAPAGCIASGSTAVCALGDLAVGASRTLLFEGTVRAGTAAGTQLVHTATVTFDGTDAVEANNRDADTILVIVALQQPSPTTTTTPRLRCVDLTFAEAQRELAAGATYLDADNDGIACEANAGGGGGAGRLPVTGMTIGVLLASAAAALVIGGGLRAGVRRHRR